MPTMRYIIVPGYVTSRNDGDDHWIDAATLARLYGLTPSEYKAARNQRQLDLLRHQYPEAHILRPQYTGDYRTPK